MARIDTLKFTINGVDYSSNINVTKDGVFKISLNHEVSKALGFDYSERTAKTLTELKSEIIPKYHDYLESKQVEEVFIRINYESSGGYNNHHNSKFKANFSFTHGASVLRFDFEVFIKVSNSTGTTQWYKAIRGKDKFKGFREDNVFEDEKWYKDGTYHNLQGVIIPFTEQALETLQKAKSGISQISDILYNFISQDVVEIEESLKAGNLLKA